MLSAHTEGKHPDEFWLRTLLRWYIGLVIRPSPTIREIVERPGLIGILLAQSLISADSLKAASSLAYTATVSLLFSSVACILW